MEKKVGLYYLDLTMMEPAMASMEAELHEVVLVDPKNPCPDEVRIIGKYDDIAAFLEETYVDEYTEPLEFFMGFARQIPTLVGIPELNEM